MNPSEFKVEGHQPERVYPYVDADGNVVGAVARFAPGTLDEKKTFRQYRYENGSYRIGLNGSTLPLYRLPRVVEAVANGTTTCVVEGEKCVEALEALGWVTTTNPGGAGKWRPEYAESLRGADVVVMGDKDEPGRRHVAVVCRSLHGVAKRVRLLPELPDVRAHGDVADWLADGNGTTELLNLLNGVEDWKPDAYEWPEPIPFPVRREGEPFPAEGALPPAMYDYARAVAAFVQADVAAVAAALPVVVSAAAGNAFTVRVNRQGYEEPCLSRYVVVSVPPGERKTATFGRVTAPLSEWAEEERPKWRAEKAAVEAHNAAVDERARELRRKAAKAKGDALEDALRAVEQCVQERRTVPRRPIAFSSDFTSPALVRIMHANGGGHAVFSGDARTVGDQLLGQHRADGRADDALYLMAHGGDSFDRGRVGARGDGEYLEIEHPSLALCLYVQPDKVAELAAHRSLSESGFLARLNLVQPRSLVGHRLESGNEPPFPDALARQWRDAILPIMRLRYQVVDRDGYDPIRLRLSPEAMDERRPFYNELEEGQLEGNDLCQAREFASKAAGETARLAALFHLFECARQGRSPEDRPEIPVECWRWAETHQRWQLAETLRGLGLAQEHEEERLARRLLLYVARDREGRSTVSASDVVAFRVARDVAHAEWLLRLLADRQWVREAPAQGGQRKPRWEFHPLVWVEPAELEQA